MILSCHGRYPSPAAISLQREIDRNQNVHVVEDMIDFGNSSLYIEEAENITISGKETMLLFEPGHGVLISNSKNVTLQNFVIEYDPPCFSQGTVKDVDEYTASIQFTLDPLYPSPTANWIALSAEIKTIFFDKMTSDFIPNQPMANSVQKVMQISENSFNITLPPFVSFIPSVGMRVTIQPRLGSVGWEKPKANYKSPSDLSLGVGPSWSTSTTWLLAESSNIKSKNIAIHGAGDFAILESGGSCGHTFHNITLTRKQSLYALQLNRPRSLISSNIDAMHSWACGKGFLIENSSFEYSGDDFINIHGQFMIASSITESEMLIIDYGNVVFDSIGPRARMLSTFASVDIGESLLFYPTVDAAFSNSTLVSIISKKRIHDSQKIANALKLPEKLNIYPQIRPRFVEKENYPYVWSVEIKGNSFEKNTNFFVEVPKQSSSGAVIKNSTFRHSYDRSAQLSSSNVLYQNNKVYCRQGNMGGIEIQCLPSWLESSFQLENITITNNEMVGCGLNSSKVFDTSPLACSVTRVKDLTEKNNTFTEEA
eukprot:g2635.t1